MSHPILDSLVNHRSIRKFKDQSISPGHLDQILAAAIRAPSASNLQHYTLVVVQQPQTIKTLGWEGAPLAIVALVDEYRIRRWLETRQDQPVDPGSASHFFISFWDAILTLHQAVVAAESLGVGTCYFGGILGVNVYDILGAPEHTFPAGMAVFGYPDEAPDLSMRLPGQAVIHHERYHLPTEEELRQWYQEREAKWEQTSQKTRQRLAEQGIFSIPQAIRTQKYTRQALLDRDQGIFENIKRSKFDLTDE